MCLHSNSLGSEVLTSNHNLVDVELGFGHSRGLKERVEVDSASLGGTIQFIKLDQVEDLLFMSRSSWSTGEFGQSPVKRLLSSLKSRSGGPSTSGFLSPHSKTTSGTLPGRDTTSLTVLALTCPGRGTEIAEGEFLLVEGGFVSCAALPVVNFHGEGGSIVGGADVAGGEGGETRRCGY